MGLAVINWVLNWLPTKYTHSPSRTRNHARAQEYNSYLILNVSKPVRKNLCNKFEDPVLEERVSKFTVLSVITISDN